MSNRYRYTHGIPAVLPFTHGQDGVTVHRSAEHLADQPEEGTVILGLGDEITLAEEFVHPYLTEESLEQRNAREQTEAAAAKAAAKAGAAVSPAAAPALAAPQSGQGEKAPEGAAQPPTEVVSDPAPADEAPAVVEPNETGKG